MKYLSVCSGIEAASVAWEPLGWDPVAFSEIEPFPSAVLAERFPDIPNLGDMTKYHEWNIPAIDLMVGGTPCQAFSVAGKRGSLGDDRGTSASLSAAWLTTLPLNGSCGKMSPESYLRRIMRLDASWALFAELTPPSSLQGEGGSTPIAVWFLPKTTREGMPVLM